MSRAALLACLVLLGCSSRRQVAIEIRVPDLDNVETPIAGVLVSALPYDRDSLIAAMEGRGATRPHTQALDSLFRAFQAPFVDFSRAAWRLESATRRLDSLAAHRRLAAAGSPAALELDHRIQELRDSLRRFQSRRDAARLALASARDTLWPRMESLRSEVKAWESSTYAGYDTLVRRLSVNRMRQVVADTTDARGWGAVTLTTDRWWIYARVPDPQDPNAEWYWNVPVSGDTVRLIPATGRRIPRY